MPKAIHCTVDRADLRGCFITTFEISKSDWIGLAAEYDELSCDSPPTPNRFPSSNMNCVCVCVEKEIEKEIEG